MVPDRACLIVGYGYLGSRVAEKLVQGGWEVWATTRHPGPKLQQMKALGVQGVVWDLLDPRNSPLLPPFSHLVYCVAAPRGNAQVRRQLHSFGLQRLLDHLDRKHLKRLVFVSTTGVYGDHGGEWVHESTPPQPATEAGQVYLQAEQRVQKHLAPEQVVVLRMAGLYGPGRVPYAKELQATGRLAVPLEGYLNLIQVEDAAQVVVRALEHQRPSPVLLVSDGHPVQRKEFYRYLASLLGVSRPQFVPPSPESSRAIRSQADKRICNRRMLQELQLRLRFPDYRTGLADALEKQGT